MKPLFTSRDPQSPAESAPPASRHAGLRPGPVGRLFDLKRFALHDGPGIRTTAFLTGCPLRCAWCHNPEAYMLAPGDAVAPEGFRIREVTPAVLLDEVERDLPYFDRSGGGVTFSGGEPLAQPAFLLACLEGCRDRELHAVLDTCGSAPRDILLAAAGLADLVLYDIKLIDAEAHVCWTGSDNDRILGNLCALGGLGVPVQLRLPLVPGVTATDGNLDAVADFLVGETPFRSLSVLPYHRMGSGKRERLGLAAVDFPVPDDTFVQAAADRLRRRGLEVKVGD